jgi:hypothetical protein
MMFIRLTNTVVMWIVTVFRRNLLLPVIRVENI